MQAAERRARILDELGRDGAVRVRRLVQRLGVSDMTIRRDLSVLHQHGLLDKVHGGAVATAPPTLESEEERLAARAAAFARPGTAVALAASTATLALARHLVAVPDLTVVTNSVRVADTLHRAPASATVVLTGGLRIASDALVGPLAVGALGTLHVDVVFLGVRGMDETAGFSSPDLLQAETHRAMVASGERLVVIAASSRWGVTGLSSVVGLSDADVLVTDDGLPQHARRVLAEHVGEISYAEPDPGVEAIR